MRATADDRKPRPPLRRRLPVVFACVLVGIALFLNYRPRYPVAFSTRYGQTPSQQEMIDAICRLRGEEVRGQLQFVGSDGYFPEQRSTFRLPATGEEFGVRWVDTEVTSWKLGSYVPPLGVPNTPSEEFDRAFMHRYFPQVPVERMRLMGRPTAYQRGCSFPYMEVTAEGTVLWVSQCSLGWDKARTRFLKVRFDYRPLQADPRPRLTLQQAESLALHRERRTLGLVSASLDEQYMSYPGGTAEVWFDEAGAQRCLYPVAFRDLRWRWGVNPEADWCDDPPTGDWLEVDAETGATVPLVTSVFWNCLRLRWFLECSIGDTSLYGLLYPSRRLWGRPYICGRYLQSDIWAGKYSFDRKTGVFTVEDQGHRWSGRRGSCFLHGPEGLSMAWTTPRMIDGELYLPTQMVWRITGWRVRDEVLGLNLVPPSGAKPPTTD